MAEPKTPLWEGIRNSAVVKNPVLFEAVGVASVVAMATSVKSAIILATVSALELLVMEVFACLLLRRLKSRFRMPIYAVLGMLVNIPCFMFFEHFTPNEANSAGIFLPLLAVNSLIALHCERFAVKHTLRETLVDAVSAGAGYDLFLFSAYSRAFARTAFTVRRIFTARIFCCGCESAYPQKIS